MQLVVRDLVTDLTSEMENFFHGSFHRLNEAFSRYFQYFGVMMLPCYNDWDLEEQFVIENLQVAMQLDSTDDTHPMTNPKVATKKDAKDSFDNISYNKAASLVRMLSNYIGMDKFRELLVKYLNDK
jgi:aminopeptidase N